MKIVVSGPFGRGVLADEIVLAGLLRHLVAGKHETTVLSADPARTEALHDVRAVELADPTRLASTPEAWRALSEAQLLLVATGGLLSEKGTPPARAWLAPLEQVRLIGVKTGVLGVGALPIADARERIRLQRLLHNFADAVSTRDEESKGVVIGYGMSATRISCTGDPALALANGKIVYAPKDSRLGIVLAENVPSRESFGIDNGITEPALLESVPGMLKEISGDWSEVILFHDDTANAQRMAAAVAELVAGGRARLQPADRPIAEIQAEMAQCRVIFSLNLHGLLLAATVGVPSVGLAAERGAAQLLSALGHPELALAATDQVFDVVAARTQLQAASENAPAISKKLLQRVGVLARKEAQDARVIELLVPRRERFQKGPVRAARVGKRH